MAANNVKKIVYSSSCTVYGNPSKLPLTEDCDTGKCSNPYGMTKYIGERILEARILFPIVIIITHLNQDKSFKILPSTSTISF